MSELTNVFTDIATAIRTKLSTSSAFTPTQMIDKIKEIPNYMDNIQPYEYAESTINSYSGNEEFILNGGFYLCSNLSEVSFPQCIYICHNAFNGCSNLNSISFPKCKRIEEDAFYSCSALTTASFPKCESIGYGTFRYCSALSSLYLLSTSVPTLYNSNAFSNTPLSAGGSGKIYVKSSMVNAFKAATNWSYLSARIVGM